MSMHGSRQVSGTRTSKACVLANLENICRIMSVVVDLEISSHIVQDVRHLESAIRF